MLKNEDFINRVESSNMSYGEFFLNVYTVNNKRTKGYFNDFSEKAIISYNREPNQKLRNVLFENYIYYAYDKLAENTINNNKLYYFNTTYEDFKHEVIAHMIQKMDKYDPLQGKAFSYFYKICRNYLIIENNKNYNINKKVTNDMEEADNDTLNMFFNKELTDDLSEFINKFISYMEDNLTLFFPSIRDRSIAESLLYLFKNRQQLYSYKKRNVFILLRERSREDAMNITKIIRVFKNKFYELFEEYKKNGKIEKINDFFITEKKKNNYGTTKRQS